MLSFKAITTTLAHRINPHAAQLALAHAEAERIATVQPLTFVHDVSPSQAVRDASSAADSLLRDFTVDSTMRIDVFRAKQDAKRNIEASGVVLDPEEQRLVQKMILDGTRAGLALPEADREKLIKLKKEIEQASMEFRVSRHATLQYCSVLLTTWVARKTRMKRMYALHAAVI